MKKVELLAPAGDLDRLKLAFLYGADAVYIGGKEFSLRSQASNFSLEDIKEACDFAHALNRAVYVTCNIVMHNDNSAHILRYLKRLEKCGVDAIITSSLYMLEIAKKHTNLHVHMSTQLSTLNSAQIEFYARHGASRLVLGRECSLEEIDAIKKISPIEIEVFIHGGMCSAYSGKCMLSNIMTRRDANRGGCAHSCRWKYYLYEENKLVTPNYFSMSSKDLCALREIPYLIESGVESLKIEGRMKSLNYLCAVISAYRQCINDFYALKCPDYGYYQTLLSCGENREIGHGFFYGNVTTNEQQMILNDKFSKAGDFIGIVRSYDEINKIAYLEVKNKIIRGLKYLKLSPYAKPQEFTVERIIYKGQEYDSYTVAKDIVGIESDTIFKPYDIIHMIR